MLQSMQDNNQLIFLKFQSEERNLQQSGDMEMSLILSNHGGGEQPPVSVAASGQRHVALLHLEW